MNKTHATGVWVGNNAGQYAVWSPIIDKIRGKLDQWNKCHPTLFGRHLIIQSYS